MIVCNIDNIDDLEIAAETSTLPSFFNLAGSGNESTLGGLDDASSNGEDGGNLFRAFLQENASSTNIPTFDYSTMAGDVDFGNDIFRDIGNLSIGDDGLGGLGSLTDPVPPQRQANPHDMIRILDRQSIGGGVKKTIDNTNIDDMFGGGADSMISMGDVTDFRSILGGGGNDNASSSGNVLESVQIQDTSAASGEATSTAKKELLEDMLGMIGKKRAVPSKQQELDSSVDAPPGMGAPPGITPSTDGQSSGPPGISPGLPSFMGGLGGLPPPPGTGMPPGMPPMMPGIQGMMGQGGPMMNGPRPMMVMGPNGPMLVPGMPPMMQGMGPPGANPQLMQQQMQQVTQAQMQQIQERGPPAVNPSVTDDKNSVQSTSGQAATEPTNASDVPIMEEGDRRKLLKQYPELQSLPPQARENELFQRFLFVKRQEQKRKEEYEARKLERQTEKEARKAQKAESVSPKENAAEEVKEGVDIKATNQLLAMLDKSKSGDGTDDTKTATDEEGKKERKASAKKGGKGSSILVRKVKEAPTPKKEREVDDRDLPPHMRAGKVTESEKTKGPAWQLPIPSARPKSAMAGGSSNAFGGESRASRRDFTKTYKASQKPRGTGYKPRSFSSSPREGGYASTSGQSGNDPRINNITGRPRYTAMMSSSDIRFVTSKVMTPLELDDPYTQDFYFVQKNVRDNAELRQKAEDNDSPVPPMAVVPQPLWKDFKERIHMALLETKEKLHAMSRKWEEREQVLGHLTRSDAHKPKTLLSVPVAENCLDKPFSTKLWIMRQQVQKGYEALGMVQELNHLLRSSNISSDPFARSEILYEVDRAVANLAESLGIKLPDPSETNLDGKSEEILLDGDIVAVIMQSAKGKKLLSRSMNVLAPEHRWALIPVIIARLLLTVPSQLSKEENETEEKLLGSIAMFINFSQEYQETEQSSCTAADGSVAPFSLSLLKNLKQCIRGVVVAHEQKQALHGSILTCRSRAVLLNQIVELGDNIRDNIVALIESQQQIDASDKLRQAVSLAACDEWVKASEEFIGMLEEAQTQ